MAKKTAHPPESSQNQFTRRSLLSLPVVAGGILMLNAPIAHASLTITNEILKENTSTGDSLALYSNLLPEVRRSELARALQGLDQEKAVVSGALREIIQLGKSLNTKYRGATAPNSAELLVDLQRVTGRMIELEGVAEILDATREKLPFIRRFDSKVDSIHSLLLDASAAFGEAKGTIPRPLPLKEYVNVPRKNIARKDVTLELRLDWRRAGIRRLDEAISSLKELLNRDVNEATLESPLERLIVLLLGVRVAVENEAITRHHASFGGIMDVLRANIKPGSWIQIGVGYSVAFPVLIRNKDRVIREKLLMDGLRLVPGLVPSPLVDTARELSALTL